MSEAVRLAGLRQGVPVFPAHGSELDRLRAVLDVLVSPKSDRPSEQWRRCVLRRMRELIQADEAALILWLPDGPEVYAEGINHSALEVYARGRGALDRDRAQEFGMEVWTLKQLWRAKGLEISGKEGTFGDVNRIRNTVGITLELPHHGAGVSIYLHQALPRSPALAKYRLTLLEALLPAFRTAFETHLRGSDALRQVASVAAVAGQALALYDMDGKELQMNPVMRRVLEQDPERGRLRGYLRDVAGAVLAALDNGKRTLPTARSDGTRREVATSMAAYRLRGNAVGADAQNRSTAVLVSLDRVAFKTPAPDALRARYRLTVRELQVASLLMHRFSNAEIARMLGISPHTARHHTENVLLKFGVRSRAAARRLISGEPAA